LLAVGLFLLLVSLVNSKKEKSSRLPVNLFSALGLLLGASGMFFAGRIPYLGKFFYLTHPLAEWQFEFFGTSGFANPLFYSALPVFILIVFLYPWKKAATFNVGLAFGMGAFLLAESLFPDAGIQWIPGRLLETLWLAGNSVICFVLGILSSFRVR
jgi:hypothetical protein